jgi:hypothetical protein
MTHTSARLITSISWKRSSYGGLKNWSGSLICSRLLLVPLFSIAAPLYLLFASFCLTPALTFIVSPLAGIYESESQGDYKIAGCCLSHQGRVACVEKRNEANRLYIRHLKLAQTNF